MAFLQLNQISKRFGGIVAVDGVDLDLKEGELTALIGPNGAGKSTLFNLISGHAAPSAGTIQFADTDITGWAPHDVAALGAVRTFQLVQLFGPLTVAENVHIGFHLRTRGGVGAAIVRPPWFAEQERTLRRETDAILQSVGLASVAEERANNLSYGRQRLLEVARALAAKPKLLLLDEPAAGLTLPETDALAALIRQINESGVTVLVVEHDMAMVMRLADRIVVLDSGRKIAEGTPDDIRRDSAVIAAYLGTAASDG